MVIDVFGQFREPSNYLFRIHDRPKTLSRTPKKNWFFNKNDVFDKNKRIFFSKITFFQKNLHFLYLWSVWELLGQCQSTLDWLNIWTSPSNQEVVLIFFQFHFWIFVSNIDWNQWRKHRHPIKHSTDQNQLLLHKTKVM